MSDAANLDKRGREPGTGLAPDKKEAHVDRGTGSDASTALAALGGEYDLDCNRAASQGNSSPATTIARARKHDHPLGTIAT